MQALEDRLQSMVEPLLTAALVKHDGATQPLLLLSLLARCPTFVHCC